MAATAHRPATPTATGTLRLGAGLMAVAGRAFIGYAVSFFVRDFTGAFLELGIGPGKVPVSRADIQAFSPE